MHVGVTEGAVYLGVKNWRIWHCPSWTGGAARRAGVVVQMICSRLINHPVCADSGASQYFLYGTATPPVQEG
jgi:hypothetical protein